MLLLPGGDTLDKPSVGRLGLIWNQEGNQHLSKCPVEGFDLFLLPLKLASVPALLTLLLLAAIQSCLLSRAGRE